MSDKKKFERLFELYTSLMLDGLVDKNKFMYQNKISLRTFQRDIEEIQLYLQIELILENDRYTLKKEDLKKLKRGFNFDNDNLKKNVDILFSVFIKKVSSNLSFIPHSTISKLLPQNIDDDYYDVIVISNNEINNISGDSESIEKLLSCVKDLNDISFDYYIQSSNINYKVKAIAYLIYYFQGIWYLVAYDKKYKKIKTYSITSISNIEVMQKLKFNSNKEKEEYYKEYKNRINNREKLIKLIEKKRSIYWSDNELTKTTICFNSDVAHYFKNRDYGFNQKIKKTLEDGSIIVNFDFSSFTELRIFLSPWLGSFKIISPEKFNKEFIEHLNNALSVMQSE
ncbi:WYL domain-containing protein [Brachyspira hampsonii]|uniref:Transcriptional regulator n=2 Tax=Brachyspira hampsonii TaxID=1287055 RepID=A0A2U4EY97_9SPIR|nr:WYL domain-containing protein [Brachyspira hampsonii]EKV56352.1 transcriptional regulator [Brachyspira hampsonii 30446]MBW5388733.1 WYL domain-containing protein [Brachyspira hampsonii]OEJ20269.1 WYL domain-containing protein [Brachyspira hampsonii]